MADGIVLTGDTGVGIDNSLAGGSTVYRQRIVIGSDATSSGFVNPSSVWPTSGTIGLPVRIVGSSGIVLGSVAQSSNWNISTGAVVGLTTTATVGLSSSIQNYVTNSTTVPVYLGPSSANVVGIVAQSSNWNISTGAVVGLTTTSVVGLTTTSLVGLSSSIQNYVTNSTAVPVYLGLSTSNIVGIVGLSSAVTLSSGTLTLGTLTTGTVVGLTTTSVVGLTTTALVGISSGTAQIGILGPSSANVIGAVAQSSNWNISTGAVVGLTTTSLVTLSSGTLTLGTLTTGTVVNVTTGSVVGLTTTAVVGLTTTALVGLSTTASIVTGVVVGSSFPASISSGNAAGFAVDPSGRLIVALHASPNMLLQASVLTAGTCGSTTITAPGASLRTAIVMVTAYTTTANASVVNLQSSSGQAGPGAWSFPVPAGPNSQPVVMDFTPPLFQPTANNGWFVVSTSSAANIRVHLQYFTLSTA